MSTHGNMSKVSKETQAAIDSGAYLKMYRGNVPKFCFVCGSELVKVRKFSHYDTQTGQEKYTTHLKCTGLLGMFHDQPFFDSDGNEAIYIG